MDEIEVVSVKVEEVRRSQRLLRYGQGWEEMEDRGEVKGEIEKKKENH